MSFLGDIFRAAGVVLGQSGAWSFDNSSDGDVEPIDMVQVSTARDNDKVSTPKSPPLLTDEEMAVSNSQTEVALYVMSEDDPAFDSVANHLDQSLVRERAASDASSQQKASKKKRNKRNKKKRSNSVTSVESIDDAAVVSGAIANVSNVSASSSRRRVTWGMVDEILFDRDISRSVVPNSGGYPLGLGEETGRGQRSVDDQCSLLQSELLTRARLLNARNSAGHPGSHSPNRRGSHGSTMAVVVLPSVYANGEFRPLESRQYDYKGGVKNPLFMCTTEEDRILILGPNTAKYEVGYMDIGADACGSVKLTELNKEVREMRRKRDDTGCTC